jgi:glycosyltransferase involved in cell wall biosynthesis
MVTPSLAAGGAERSVVLLSKEFLRQGHAVTVVTIYGTAVDSFVLAEDVERLALDVAADSHSFLHGLRNNVKRLAALRKAIRATRPDIVISNMSQTNVLTKLALTNTGLPLVLVEHSDPARNVRKGIWRVLRRATYPRAATIVSVSRGIDDYFKWLPESKKTVIPNPVSAIDAELSIESMRTQSTLPPLPDGYFVNHNKKRLVAMGRLIHVKGFDRLLLAFAKLAQKHADWQLVILGEGEQRSDLEQLITRLGLAESVQLCGFVSNPFAMLNTSELFVMSSRSEGFPYALLEAMSCGLPCVAMDCGSGPREIIRDGIDGILVPDGNIEALAVAMDRMMSDAGERRRLAQRAKEVRERFGSEKVTALWEALFDKLGALQR